MNYCSTGVLICEQDEETLFWIYLTTMNQLRNIQTRLMPINKVELKKAGHLPSRKHNNALIENAACKTVQSLRFMSGRL